MNSVTEWICQKYIGYILFFPGWEEILEYKNRVHIELILIKLRKHSENNAEDTIK